MTSPDSHQLAHRMHEAFNARDIAAADEIFAPDFYSHPLRGGLEALKAAWAAMVTAYPSARSVVEDILVDGDRVALRSTVYGVSADPDAAGGTLLEIFRVTEGRIAELWGSMDSQLPH
ncbi:hypothetical protein GCM10010441_17780 [Kitasatospora paracochleata]|uniref:SnoaL-like aldol condensation-catalyzing enzyme n=1 Tax=Kitasatospora paracochleata TaxID=58354 RepID=A0ABT1JAP1_9ACTN|nr:nuclear transport factor 2 family protein [Kitasatospora paracochleata]MCP2314189.1 putative SnoaL-like aldol condensation-catalyzing enzyme [Kitasatospora paracochleata]